MFTEGSQNASDHVAQKGHDGKVVFDEAKLDIQADILVEVARGVMRLGAEDRANLEDALEDAYHDLLVKLRALRQVRRPPEVVEFEDGGSALGGGGDDLRRLYLGKTFGDECAAKTCHGASTESQDGASSRMAVRYGCVVEHCGDVCSDLAFVQGHRWHLGHRRDDLDAQVMQFDAAWGLGLADYPSFEGYDALDTGLAFAQWSQFGLCLGHRLYDAPAITDHQKIDAAELAQ